MVNALELLEEFIQIGAPTFQEKRRSDFVLDWLRNNASPDAEQDAMGNVWLDLSGGAERVVLFDAHIDTVFPYTEVRIKKETARWHAPGIFDNGAACVLLMLYARKIARAGKTPPLLLSFTVGEEGLGNLCGIRAMVERFEKRLAAGFLFDLQLDGASHTAVGSLRYEMLWSAQGGHSWNAFGNISAIHQAAAWIQKLETAFPWKLGERSFNVGTISGGTGVNVIAQNVRIKLDLRSTDAEFLRELSAWMDGQVYTTPECSLSIEKIGDRPAGHLPPDHALLSVLEAVHGELQIPIEYKANSTNANALLGAGIPAITTGIASGKGIHTEAEYLLLDSLEPGFQKLGMLGERLTPLANG